MSPETERLIKAVGATEPRGQLDRGGDGNHRVNESHGDDRNHDVNMEKGEDRKQGKTGSAGEDGSQRGEAPVPYLLRPVPR